MSSLTYVNTGSVWFGAVGSSLVCRRSSVGAGRCEEESAAHLEVDLDPVIAVALDQLQDFLQSLDLGTGNPLRLRVVAQLEGSAVQCLRSRHSTNDPNFRHDVQTFTCTSVSSCTSFPTYGKFSPLVAVSLHFVSEIRWSCQITGFRLVNSFFGNPIGSATYNPVLGKHCVHLQDIRANLHRIRKRERSALRPKSCIRIWSERSRRKLAGLLHTDTTSVSLYLNPADRGSSLNYGRKPEEHKRRELLASDHLDVCRGDGELKGVRSIADFILPSQPTFSLELLRAVPE
jgi:hypothetical protein